MPVENVTPNRSYQLPHPDNDLVDDVARIIAALSGVDLDVAAILSALLSKSPLDHGHVIGDITGLASALLTKQDLDEKGQANGYAALGSDGKVPAGQLPAALFGGVSYQGTWNANTNTPTMPAAGAGNKGWYYKVSTAGSTTVNGVNDWEVGDWVVSNGVAWDKIDNTDQVMSVAGLRGAITAASLKTALDLKGAAYLDVGTTAGTVAAGDDPRFDPWAMQPIGVPVPLLDNLVGVAAPPTDKAYRYVLLTAGAAGSGQYNAGVLTSESVSGSAPLVVATAVISLSGSPVNGKTINLINTERRFLRAGSAGTVQNDAMQQITGAFSNRATDSGTNVTFGGIDAFTTSAGSGSGATVNGSGTTRTQQLVSFDSANSPDARTDAETRSRNIGVTYYLRIK